MKERKQRFIAKINYNKVLEFYGAMLGDGCLSQYPNENRIRKAICISGNALKDVFYLNDYMIPLIRKYFGIRTKLKIRKSDNTANVYMCNPKLFEFLHKNGFPIGVKGQIKIPSHIYKLPLNKVNHLIRGFFDTDGCISARKDEHCELLSPKGLSFTGSVELG